MTLNELSEAWNNLHNAVVGHGLTPTKGVKPETATKIGNYYDRWRQWFANAVPADDVFTSVTAAPWVELYREAVQLAKADGLEVPNELPSTALEQTTKAIDSAGNRLWYAAAAIALPLALLLALRNRH